MSQTNIRYVAKGGLDSNDGLSWQAPKLTVRAAIDSLPLANAAEDAVTKAGLVLVGPGEFVEQPMQFNTRLHIVGVAPHLTTIKLADAAESPLFSPVSYTGFSHFVRLEQLTLDGNKANNPGVDIMWLSRGGYNAVLRDVTFANAGGLALRVLVNAVNLYLYNCSGAGCDDGFLRLELDSSSNLCNLGLWGTQIDDCGDLAPIQIAGQVDGDVNQVVISGLKCEARAAGRHRHIVHVDNTGTNPVLFTVDGVSAYQEHAWGSDDAVIREAGSQRNVWSLRNIVRTSGMSETFRSSVSGKVVTNGIREALFNGTRLAD